MFSSKAGKSRKDTRIEAWVKRCQTNPHETSGLKIGRRLQKTKRLDEAFKWTKRLKKDFPTSRRVRKLYRKLKRRKTLIALANAKAKASVRTTAENLARLSEILRIAGRGGKAFRLARKADKRFPDNWQIQLLLGKLYFDRFSKTRGEDTGWTAVEHLDRSRCLNPTNYSTLIVLAVTLTRLGSYEDALVIIDEALQVSPSDRRAVGLRERVKKALSEQAADGTRRGEGESGAVGGEVDQFLSRVMELPGAVGVYRFDSNGGIMDKLVTDNQSFEFSVPVEVFEAMAAACQLDTHRIGLGRLHSCSLSGDGWNVDYHASDSGPLLTFFEGNLTGEQVEDGMRVALAEASTISA